MIDVRQRADTRADAGGRRFHSYLPLAYLATDVALAYAAFSLAYVARYVWKLGPAIQQHISFGRYQPVGLLMVLLLTGSLSLRGAYESRMSRDVIDDLGDVVGAATVAIGIIVVLDYMLHKFQYSRGVIVYLWILSMVALALGRVMLRWMQMYLHRHGRGVRRLLVVGAGDLGKMVMQSVMARPDLGYDLVGFVEHRPAANVRDFGRFRALGAVDSLPALLNSRAVDEVILAVPAAAHEVSLRVLELCEQTGVKLKLVPDLFEMSLSRVRLDDIAGIPLMDVRDTPMRPVAIAVKRTVDLVGAVAGLILASPIFLIVPLLIRLESPGHAVLRQRRVGLGGAPFTCYKFRTMHSEAEHDLADLESHNDADGPVFKMRDDPRCTRLGRKLRRLSLDELPQLWNVLRGEMSLVGPRPALPREVERYEPQQRRRLEMKPGMTGIWQVSGRSDLGFDEMILMDTTYIDNWSVRLDARILARTVVAVLRRRGAY